MKISIEAEHTYHIPKLAGDLSPTLCEQAKHELVAELAGTCQSLIDEELVHWHIDQEARTITGTIDVSLDPGDEIEEPEEWDDIPYDPDSWYGMILRELDAERDEL